MSSAVLFLMAGTTSWTVPAGLAGTVRVEIIASGGWGSSSSNGSGQRGGGGGAYAIKAAAPVTPGEVIPVFIAPPNIGTSTETSYFRNLTTVAVQSGYQGNGVGYGGSWVAGDTGYNGGSSSNTSGTYGGGGAAGPNGAGGWGSGNGGGGANGGAYATSTGGGNNRLGTGGGAQSDGSTVAAQPGVGGGGGGRGSGSGSYDNGAPGGMEIIWTQTLDGKTAGPGGGGGQSGTAGAGGAGGGYGGGGGGARNSGAIGAPGIIVLTYPRADLYRGAKSAAAKYKGASTIAAHYRGAQSLV